VPLVNSVYVRWARGLAGPLEDAASIAAHGRHEHVLQLGGSQSPEDAMNAAQAWLGINAWPRVATTVGLRPTGTGDQPFVDFGLGDTLPAPDEAGGTSDARVRSLPFADHPANVGQVVYSPELRAAPAEAEDHLQRWLQRMATGGGGSAATAPPVPVPVQVPDPPERLPPFSWAVVRVRNTGRFYLPVAVRLLRVVFSLDVPGTTSTTAELHRNGLAIATYTFAAGQSGNATVALVTDVAADEWLQGVCSVAGAGAEGMVIQPEGV
jgi:hypothetical protein